jgi:hypothetical protein
VSRRETVEQLSLVLRRRAALWRAEEAKRGKVAAALLWQFNEQWIARIEGLAAELDAHAGQLRQAEAAEQARPATPAKDRKRKRGKERTR